MLLNASKDFSDLLVSELLKENQYGKTNEDIAKIIKICCPEIKSQQSGVFWISEPKLLVQSEQDKVKSCSTVDGTVDDSEAIKNRN